MVKKYARANNSLVFYLDNEADSDTALVFIHANSLDSLSFKNQFQHPSLSVYRLLALDLPGCGDSESNTSFTIPDYAVTIVDFCKNMNAEKIVLIGHSLGGHLAVHSLPYISNCQGIVIFGAPPLEHVGQIKTAFLQHEAVGLLFRKRLSPEEIDRVSAALSREKVGYDYKKSIRKANGIFREHLAKYVALGQIENEVEILNNKEIPVAILHGEHDHLVALNYLHNLKINQLWENRIVVFQNCGHSPQLEKPEEFNITLAHFLQSIY